MRDYPSRNLSRPKTMDVHGRDIQERHLLRLGAGSSDIYKHSQKDFSKWGRVNMTLARRLHLLGEVCGVLWHVTNDYASE